MYRSRAITNFKKQLEYKYFKKILSILSKKGFVVFNVRADSVWKILAEADYVALNNKLNYLTDNLVEVMTEEDVIITTYELDKVAYYKITFKK